MCLSLFNISHKPQLGSPLLGLGNLLLQRLMLADEVAHAGGGRQALPLTDGLQLFQHIMQPGSICRQDASGALGHVCMLSLAVGL